MFTESFSVVSFRSVELFGPDIKVEFFLEMAPFVLLRNNSLFVSFIG
jgi:hypothetical protein